MSSIAVRRRVAWKLKRSVPLVSTSIVGFTRRLRKSEAARSAASPSSLSMSSWIVLASEAARRSFVGVRMRSQ